MQNQAYFVGIDLHKELIQVCVLDGRGEKIAEHRFPGGSLEQGLAVVKFLSQWKDGGRFAVEALGMNRWLVNAMQAQGMEVVVVDAVKLNLRMLGKKTDRRDAYPSPFTSPAVETEAPNWALAWSPSPAHAALVERPAPEPRYRNALPSSISPLS